MLRPRLFISAVSEEFGSVRRAVAATVQRLGFDPVTQEDFPTGYGELRQWLREQIQSCEGLLQLVGQGYGAEPPEVDADYGRVSYTQFEFRYAQRQGKKTWVIVLDDGYPRDTPVDRLDLPRDSAPPGPAGYQAERRRLQEAYLQRLRDENHLRHRAGTVIELENTVLRLRDELAELREKAKWHERRVVVSLAVLAALLVVLGAGSWWAWQRMQHTVIEAGRVDSAKIRAHLLTAAEQAHDRDLAEAGKATGWEERQRLREAAEAAHAARLAKLDGLAQTIAEIEGRGDATTVMREMTRVLREESVDAALAYLATQRTSVLQRVKARAAAAREENRAELEPLLTAASLEATRGHAVAARAAYEEILALDPAWPRAITDYAWFLYGQSDLHAIHGSLTQAVTDTTRLLELAERLPKVDLLPLEDARVLPAALDQMAKVLALRGQPGDAENTLEYSQRSLELSDRLLWANPNSTEVASDVSASLNNLAGFLAQRDQPGDADKALRYFQRSLELSERLLRADPNSSQAVRELSLSLYNLADFLGRRGQPADVEKAFGYLQWSLKLSEGLLRANPSSAQVTHDVSTSLNKLAPYLVQRAQPGDAERALGYLQRSVELSEGLLRANPKSAQAARDASLSMNNLAQCLVQRAQPGDVEKALGYLQRSLELSEGLLRANPNSSRAVRDLLLSLYSLTDFLGRHGQPSDAEKALGYLQRSVEFSEGLLRTNPHSAQAARDVSAGLERLGDFLVSRGLAGGVEKALGYYQRSLEVKERLLGGNLESAEAARDVVVSHFKLAQFGLKTGDQPLAERHLGACHTLLHERISAGVVFDPPIMRLYQQLHADFGGGQ